MGPDQSAPMSPAPRAAAVPKPPPAEALQRPAHFFDNLTGTAEDTPRHSEPDTPPHSEQVFEIDVLSAVKMPSRMRSEVVRDFLEFQYLRFTAHQCSHVKLHEQIEIIPA